MSSNNTYASTTNRARSFEVWVRLEKSVRCQKVSQVFGFRVTYAIIMATVCSMSQTYRHSWCK